MSYKSRYAEQVKQAVAEAPPLTDDQLNRLAGLLAGFTVDAGKVVDASTTSGIAA